jgi:hypothetical protein
MTALGIFFPESFFAGLFSCSACTDNDGVIALHSLNWGNKPQYEDVVSLASYAESPLVHIPEACRHIQSIMESST